VTLLVYLDVDNLNSRMKLKYKYSWQNLKPEQFLGEFDKNQLNKDL
jgi:hypothetical protein